MTAAGVSTCWSSSAVFRGPLMVAQNRQMGPLSARSSLPKNCAGCHGVDGRGRQGRRLHHAERRRALSGCRSDWVVQDGTGGHAVVLQLGDANIRAVVDFLRTLQGKTPTNAAAKVATGYDAGKKIKGASAHRGRYARQPLGGGRPFGRQSDRRNCTVQDPAQTLDRSALSRGCWSQRPSKRLRITPRLDGNHIYVAPPAPVSSM